MTVVKIGVELVPSDFPVLDLSSAVVTVFSIEYLLHCFHGLHEING